MKTLKIISNKKVTLVNVRAITKIERYTVERSVDFLEKGSEVLVIDPNIATIALPPGEKSKKLADELFDFISNGILNSSSENQDCENQGAINIDEALK